jgi:hypothetical protein
MSAAENGAVSPNRDERDEGHPHDQPGVVPPAVDEPLDHKAIQRPG